jgi:hypothetical protein
MEKKGDLFNQLAIIADLVEKCNLHTENKAIILDVEKNEFERIYNMVARKSRMSGGLPKNSFNLKIGEVNIVFNTSNV